MNLDDAGAPPCGVDEEQLIAYLDGELAGVSRERMAAHVAECDCCTAIAVDLACADEALGGLPELRCPDRVVAAAEEVSRVSPAKAIRRGRVAGLAGFALAAGLAGIALWPAEPTPRLTKAEREKLVEVRRAVSNRAVATGAHALDRGVVRPTRRVIATISDGPLGRWSTRAAVVFQRPNDQATDPT